MLFLSLSPVLIPTFIKLFMFIKDYLEYKKSLYYQTTKLSFFSVRNNIGKYGEYLIYQQLKKFETNGAKFLFNAYIPKSNGETTEIDVLMICSKGIFVFESKNYSGWIFGSEDNKNWCQTLPAGRKTRKEYFYNPIMQNKSHIKHLKALIGDQIPIHSIIAFSDRCTLKDIQIQNNDVVVINRYEIINVVSDIYSQITNDLLSAEKINDIYNGLYPFTQIDENSKEKHIETISNNIDNIVNKQANASSDTILLQNKSTKIDNTINKELKCPKCNGNLVLRTATKGSHAGNQFYGCSNYPKCKYIQNTNNEVNN